jgi:hypothetical protein
MRAQGKGSNRAQSLTAVESASATAHLPVVRDNPEISR